jgi:hypothetical protein
MVRVEAAVTKAGPAEFVVLAVKPWVIGDMQRRLELQQLAEEAFGRRTALLGEDGRTWGPPDLVRWLEDVAVEDLPWREYSITN